MHVCKAEECDTHIRLNLALVVSGRDVFISAKLEG